MVLSKGLVAVTGASGYIGSWCVKYLAENGYQVRGTVRSLKNPAKVQHLRDMKEVVHLFEADLLEDGSFDDCFAGCTAVFHVASPFQIGVDDPQKSLVDPAVKGTLNVLESCKKAGITRVVQTASCASIVEYDAYIDPEKYKDKIWTEKDWNTTCTLENSAYSFSKVMAEQAAWEFCRKNDIKLTTICPNFVMGPPLSPRTDSTSVKTVLGIMMGAFLKDGLPPMAFGTVDVRTVAEAHVLALGNKQAENERFLVGGRDSMTCLDYVNYLRLDQRLGALKMPSHFAQPVMGNIKYDNSKAVKVLGLKFRPPAIAIIDLGNFLVDNGIAVLPMKDEDDGKLSIE